MKTPCEIIRDLLPLYKDDVCSKESRMLVDEHLKECEPCRDYYKKMNTDLPPITESAEPEGKKKITDEILVLKQIKQRITLRTVIAVFLAIVLVTVVYTVWNTLDYEEQMALRFKILDDRVSVDDIKVEELYLLDNGDVYVSLSTEAPVRIYTYELSELDYPYAEGNVDTFTFNRKWLDFSNLFFGSYSRASFTVPSTLFYLEDHENSEGAVNHSIASRKRTGVYYEGKHGERLTIWKEGDPIDNAPPEIEEMVARSIPKVEQYRDAYQAAVKRTGKNPLKGDDLEYDVYDEYNDQLFPDNIQERLFTFTRELLLENDYMPNFSYVVIFNSRKEAEEFYRDLEEIQNQEI